MIVESLICGESKEQGGEYEWVCVREPHPDNPRLHSFRAFKWAEEVA